MLNFYLHVLTTKDNAENSSSRAYTIYIAKLEIGDYVKYVPSNITSTYNLKATYSGHTSDQIIDNSYDPQSWRIMELDTNGNVTKLLGIGSKSVYFQGSTGYNNGVYLLNDICKSRYGNAILGATARSLNIEDIESRMNVTGIAARNTYKAGSTQYGTTKTFAGGNEQYPAIYAKEKYSGVNVSDVIAGTQIISGKVDASAKAKMNPNGKSDSDDIYTTLPETSEKIGPSPTNLTCTQTYYGGSQLNSSYDDTNFYKMIFKTETDFWLSSRCVNCDSDYWCAGFGIRLVHGSDLYGISLFDSYGSNNCYGSRLAPIVSLGSKIHVTSGAGTESTPYILGK